MMNTLHRIHEQHAAVVRERSFDNIYTELSGLGLIETFYRFSVSIVKRKSETVLRCFDLICRSDDITILRLAWINEEC